MHCFYAFYSLHCTPCIVLYSMHCLYAVSSMQGIVFIFKSVILCMVAFSSYRVCVSIYLCIYLWYLTPWELGLKFNTMPLHLEYYKVSLTPSFDRNCCIFSFNLHMRKFVYLGYTYIP